MNNYCMLYIHTLIKKYKYMFLKKKPYELHELENVFWITTKIMLLEY